MPSGQARLLFSSAQVEYIRYWLHSMQLTKTLIPLPSSDYLLTASTLRNWSPVIYKDADALKKALKVQSDGMVHLADNANIIITGG